METEGKAISGVALDFTEEVKAGDIFYNIVRRKYVLTTGMRVEHADMYCLAADFVNGIRLWR